MFKLTKEKIEKISTWKLKHKHNYQTAIGGQFTYKFTQTSLGVVCVFEYSYGGSVDVTDYESW